jgi:hypothetical protein
MKSNIFAGFLVMVGLIIGSTLGYKTMQLREGVTNMELEITKLEVVMTQIEQLMCLEIEEHKND